MGQFPLFPESGGAGSMPEVPPADIGEAYRQRGFLGKAALNGINMLTSPGGPAGWMAGRLWDEYRPRRANPADTNPEPGVTEPPFFANPIDLGLMAGGPGRILPSGPARVLAERGERALSYIPKQLRAALPPEKVAAGTSWRWNPFARSYSDAGAAAAGAPKIAVSPLGGLRDRIEEMTHALWDAGLRAKADRIMGASLGQLRDNPAVRAAREYVAGEGYKPEMIPGEIFAKVIPYAQRGFGEGQRVFRNLYRDPAFQAAMRQLLNQVTPFKGP